MKKNYLWITLIGLMVMAAGFVSCSKDDDDKESGDIVGTWVSIEANCDGYIEKIPAEYAAKVTFKSDGTFCVIEKNHSDNGTWKYENGILSLIHDDGEKVEIKVKKLTSSTLIIEDSDDYDCDATFKRSK